MKKIIFTISLMLSLFAVLNSQARNELRIGDPQNSWWYQNIGSIESASLSVKAAGMFAEYTLDITFSAKGSGLSSALDTLEVNYTFDLPDGAIVTDSYLWVEGEMQKASMMSRWTASQVYEGIVGRRQDPSILTENNWSNDYNLKVFPLIGNSSRKVRLKFLVPMQWEEQKVAYWLPTPMLKVSQSPVDLDITIEKNDSWRNLAISGKRALFLKAAPTDYKTTIPWDRMDETFLITYDTQYQKDVFFSCFANHDNGYYQLAFNPEALFNLKASKRLMVVLDIDPTQIIGNYSYYDTKKMIFEEQLPIILGELKQNLQEKLKDVDYFNVIYANPESQRISENWMPATEYMVNRVFDNLSEHLKPNATSMVKMMNDAIEFVQQKNDDGRIFMLSNNHSHKLPTEADEVLVELSKKMKDGIVPISIVDFYRYDYWRDRDNNDFFVTVNNRRYRENEYLYRNLCFSTGGDYRTVYNSYYYQNYGTILDNITAQLNGTFDVLAINIVPTGGFTYDNYTTPSNLYASNPTNFIFQTGKYQGGFPFEATIYIEYKGEQYVWTKTINEGDIIQGNEFLKKVWAGTMLNQFEKTTYNYYYSENAGEQQVIKKVIRYSLAERILTPYTAFLALEPDMFEDLKEWSSNFEDANSVQDEGMGYDGLENGAPESPGRDITINIEPEAEALTLKIYAYPNPFTDFMTVKINLPKTYAADEVSLKIFDLQGKLVKVIDVDHMKTKSLDVAFDGSDLKSGTYLILLTTPDGIKTLKVIKN